MFAAPRGGCYERKLRVTLMGHRFASSFALVSALLFPIVASAQAAGQGSWQGASRPQNAPSGAYAQPTYAQTYSRPAYAVAPYPATARPVPAAYAYRGQPAYAGQQQTYAGQQPTYPMPSQTYAGPPAPYSNQPPNYAGTYGQPPAGNYGWGYRAAPTNAVGAEAPGPLVQTKDNLHYVEMGMGAFVPTDQGNPAKFGLEASLWAIHGGWVPNSGLYLTFDASTGFDVGCLAKRATDGCKGHLRIHWIGTGPFFNTGTPMIAGDIARSWDLMALTGAEVRIWKGMTLKTTLNWFLPNPWGVYAHEQARAEGQLRALANPMAGTASVQIEDINPMDRVESVIGHALSHPQLNLMAMWEF
jgi:hypothetical protein